jgi:hypothetical protein
MSEEDNDRQIGGNIYDEGNDVNEESAEEEEEVTATEIPAAETFSEESSSMTDNVKEEEEEDHISELHRRLREHSTELSKLKDTAESLQSRVKRLEEATPSSDKTRSSAIKRRKSKSVKIKKSKANSQKSGKNESRKKKKKNS